MKRTREEEDPREYRRAGDGEETHTRSGVTRGPYEDHRHNDDDHRHSTGIRYAHDVDDALRRWRERAAVALDRYVRACRQDARCRCVSDASRLHAYRVVVERPPPGGHKHGTDRTDADVREESIKPTVLVSGGQEYVFEGFTLLAHHPLDAFRHQRTDRNALPPLLVHVGTDQRTAHEHRVWLEPEKDGEFDVAITRGSVADLEWFHAFFFGTVLQLDDFVCTTTLREPQQQAENAQDASPSAHGCPCLHFFPRFGCRSSALPHSERLLSAELIRKSLLSARTDSLPLIRDMLRHCTCVN